MRGEVTRCTRWWASGRSARPGRTNSAACSTNTPYRSSRLNPGFVSGHWMHDPETGKSHTTVIFTDRQSAGGFKALVERTTRRAAQAGVSSDILTTVEVLADAHQEGRHR
jgi:hypothetical protein